MARNARFLQQRQEMAVWVINQKADLVSALYESRPKCCKLPLGTTITETANEAKDFH